MKKLIRCFPLFLLFLIACRQEPAFHIVNPGSMPFTWDNASIYFLLTDRFNNGIPENDHLHNEEVIPGPLRGFKGGDIVGITQKIKEGYFDRLGVDAIWLTPIVRQIDGWVDEGTGISFPFHGYWTKDWTSIDPRFGTEKDLMELVSVAHSHKIRILLDVVANHTGPVTPEDPKWPESWVRTGPVCTYRGFHTTTHCTLVENLPDIRTESFEEVELPLHLIEKWKEEGRYDQEVLELNQWFLETGYPRTPVYHILKWLVDFVKKYGIDGFRVDTVKHTEPYVWNDLWISASKAFEEWKKTHEAESIDDTPFYMVGEVYGYYIGSGRSYDFGDTLVDYFSNGFHALINFDFKYDAGGTWEAMFSKYDSLLHEPLVGKSVVNYISSHDDGRPFDLFREKPIESGTRLMLCPGAIQIYYGDETARTLTAEAVGDASLRSYMNWDELDNNTQKADGTTHEILTHWQKLGTFRKNHPSVGTGKHMQIYDDPYTFSRTYSDGDKSDQVVIALDVPLGEKTIVVDPIFKNKMTLRDAYSGHLSKVIQGTVSLDTPYSIVLLEKFEQN
ncbi:MAG TPA: alpha-amylase family glycosyl hydrolase [Saprospiraceae bacterium]|nr:alpha-amylase family glycosyl hydrolase [Saprospiraceae bacterium]